jgi:hypothetical protein
MKIQANIEYTVKAEIDGVDDIRIDLYINEEKVDRGWLSLNEQTPVVVKQAIVDRINGEKEL